MNRLKTKKVSKQTIAMMVMGLAMIFAFMFAGSTLAYFTASDNTGNSTITMGNLQVDLTTGVEEGATDTGWEAAKFSSTIYNAVPNQIIYEDAIYVDFSDTTINSLMAIDFTMTIEGAEGSTVTVTDLPFVLYTGTDADNPTQYWSEGYTYTGGDATTGATTTYYYVNSDHTDSIATEYTGNDYTGNSLYIIDPIMDSSDATVAADQGVRIMLFDAGSFRLPYSLGNAYKGATITLKIVVRVVQADWITEDDWYVEEDYPGNDGPTNPAPTIQDFENAYYGYEPGYEYLPDGTASDPNPDPYA